jgi:DNA-binding SARP family transcriptional activator
VGSAPAARVQLLDGFALRVGTSQQGAADVLPRGIQRLVAHLSLASRPARAVIAGQLWPNVPEHHANGSLRSALWRLQRIAPGLVRMHGDTLSLAEGVAVDVRELAGWARRVRDPASDLDELSTTDLRLGGELLPGWFDEWVLLERERLRQLRMHALETLADRLAAVGRYGEALRAAYAAVRVEPLRESAHRTLIRVHLAEGDTLEAMSAYEACRTLLADELGVFPSRQMSDLVRDLPLPRRPRHLVPLQRAAERVGRSVVVQ